MPKKRAAGHSSEIANRLWHWELSKKELVVGLFVLIIGFYLRIEPALFNLSHFSFDQGLDQILVKRLVVDKDITLVSRYSGLEGVFMGPLFTWIMAIPFFLSGGDPNANVIFLSLLSTGFSVITYLVVKEMTDKKVALISTLLVTFSPSFMASSKIVLSPSPLTFLSILHVFLVWQCVVKQKRIFLPILGLFLGILFQFEIGYALFALIATAVTVLIFTKLRLITLQSLVVSTIAFIVPFVPQIVFDIRNNFIMSRAIWGYLSGTNTSLGQIEGGLFVRFIDRLSIFTQDLTNTISFGNRYQILGLLLFTILVNGLIQVFKSGDKQLQLITKVTLTLLSALYIGFMFYSGPVWAWYRAGVPFFFIFLLAISIRHIWEISVKTKTLLLIVTFILVVVSIDPQGRIDIWQNRYIGDVSTLRNQELVLDYIYKDAAGEPFSLYVYTSPVYPWIWDYQIWWYAQNKYGYLPQPYDRLPQPNNPDRVYLIVEPPAYESDLKGWRGHFEPYAELISRQKVAGEVSVEQWNFVEQPQEVSPLIKYVNVFEGE